MKFRLYQIKVETFSVTLSPRPANKKTLVFPRHIRGGVAYPSTGAATKMEETEMVIFRVCLDYEEITKLFSARFDIAKFVIKNP